MQNELASLASQTATPLSSSGRPTLPMGLSLAIAPGDKHGGAACNRRARDQAAEDLQVAAAADGHVAGGGVEIDDEGKLCWAKNGERISTTVEYKDSVNGIVPKDDTSSPTYGPYGRIDGTSSRRSSTSSSSSSSSSDSAEHSDVEGEHYVNHDLDKAKGLGKIKHVSAAAVLNHLLRGSVKPNSWIFVSRF